MKSKSKTVKHTLTKQRPAALFLVMNQMNRAEMIRLADGLEAAAKSLRDAVKIMDEIREAPTTLEFAVSDTQPSVKDAAINALRAANRALHINDLFEAVRKQGAQVKDVAVLSSILSRDESFTSTQPRGHWELNEVIM